MSDTAYQIQYRDEFIAGFEQHQSLLRDSVTTEVQVKGNQATFLIADSGGAEAVTRGVDGLIPGRPDNLTQQTVTLTEWHDKPQRTGFNLFASQGDGRRIMQMTSMAVINRKINSQIINDALASATVNTGAAQIATMTLVAKAKAILGLAKVPNDGQIYAAVTPAFMMYLHMLKEFSSAEYVNKKPIDSGEAFWDDMPGYYQWLNVKWFEQPDLPGVGTSSESCFMYHKSALGHAAPGELIQTYADYNKENDYSYSRCTAYMGAKLLQNSGVVKMVHDGSQLVAA